MPAITLAATVCRHYEGLRLEAYQCPAGVWTIGYGATGPGIHQGVVWTEQQAETRLLTDLTDAQAGVLRVVRVPLAGGEQAALISFVFNLGLGNLRGSTLLQKLNAGDRINAASEFVKWDKALVAGRIISLPGLTRRRVTEATLFRTGEITFPTEV